jgi:hypothetical protein
MPRKTTITLVITSTGVDVEKKSIFKKIYDFIFSPHNPKESVFQWIVRQFLLSDHDGNPSWTLTFAFIVIAYSGIAVITQSFVAMSYIETFDAAGHILSRSMKGFSSEFWYAIITFFTAIAYLFRQRNKDKVNSQNTEDGTIPPEIGGELTNTVVDAIKSIIAKIKK